MAFIKAWLEKHWSPPGETSDNGVWVAWGPGHMYTGETRLKLLLDMIKNWNNDSALVG